MSPNQRDIIVWIDVVLNAMRQSLRNSDFEEFLPAILSSRFEPGARHSVAVMGNRAMPRIEPKSSLRAQNQQTTVEGARTYFLPVSHCVEKQLVLEHASRVFCVAPCVRLLMDGEHVSRRHLYTFFQVEVELRTSDIGDVFRAAESILGDFSMILTTLLRRRRMLDDSIRSRVEALARVPFPKLTFDQARQLLPDSENEPPNPHNTNDFSHAQEEYLASAHQTPFWIFDYPEDVRDCPFHKNERGNYDTFDLMMPQGYGELSTGGIRPQTSEEIVRLSRTMGRDVFHPDYANWKSRTRVQTGGFGIGLERLIRYCAGAESILDLRQLHDSGPNASIELEASEVPISAENYTEHQLM